MVLHSADLCDALMDCERRVWDALLRGDAAADAAALCDSFLGVYADGFADKSAHVGQLAAGPTVMRYHLSEAQARPLGGDFGLLSYRAEFLRQGRAQLETMYVTSIWQRRDAERDSGWVNIFSQDTAAV